jgi:hypothetical protein
MAPEQLDSVEADRAPTSSRSASSCTDGDGQEAFEGKRQVLLISAIATSSPPPLSLVQPETPCGSTIS